MYNAYIGAPRDNRTTNNRFVVRTDTSRDGCSWKTRCCSVAATTFLIAFGAGMIATNSASHAAASHEVAGTESFSFGTGSSQPYLHAMDTDTDTDLAPIVVAQASGGGAGADHPEMVDGDSSGWFVEGGLSVGEFDFIGFNVGVGRVFENGIYGKLRLTYGEGTETILSTDVDFDGVFLLISSGAEIALGHYLGGGIGIGALNAKTGSFEISVPGTTAHVEYVAILSNNLVLSVGLDTALGVVGGVGFKF